MFKKENTIHFQGEILMRLSANDFNNENISFKSFIGGAELNVAIALSGLGHKTNFYSVLPNNFIGNYIKDFIDHKEINTKNILQNKGNMGIYFVGGIANDIEKKNVSYSRENTAYIKYSNDLISKYNFKKNDIIHVSGINSLINTNVHKTIIDVLKKAKKNNVFISFDFNYREKINTKTYAKKTYLEILEYADIIFANKRDFIEILNFKDNNKSNIFEWVMKKYDIKLIAHSNRFFENNRHAYQGVIYKNKKSFEKFTSKKTFYKLKDRIGGGDAFAAGVLHGIIKNKSLPDTVNFASELAIHKQSIVEGDSVFISEEEINEKK